MSWFLTFILFVYATRFRPLHFLISLLPPGYPHFSSGQSHPLSISYLRAQTITAGRLQIHHSLPTTDKCQCFLVSYLSQGNRVYGLLCHPSGRPPSVGWPVIILCHGYYTPSFYSTSLAYRKEVTAIASAGFIVFKPDYRGHGRSQGLPAHPLFAPDYTIDILSAIAHSQTIPHNNGHVGLFAHSLGCLLALRAMAVTPLVRAAVIWNGFGTSYEYLLDHLHLLRPRLFSAYLQKPLMDLVEQYGPPAANPDFWRSISPHYHLYPSAFQIHHGLCDKFLPPSFSQVLSDFLFFHHFPLSYYSYPKGDHGLSGSDNSLALERTVSFFTLHLRDYFSPINQ